MTPLAVHCDTIACNYGAWRLQGETATRYTSVTTTELATS